MSGLEHPMGPPARKLNTRYHGQSHREGAAPAVPAVDGDRTLMILYDTKAHRQPKPRAFPRRLGGKKWIEDLGEMLRRDAGPRIPDLQRHG